jgi:hypothetical protein
VRRTALPLPAAAQAPAWSSVDAIVVHNQDMHGARVFFAFAGACAWLLWFGVLSLVGRIVLGTDGLVGPSGLALAGWAGLGWWTWRAIAAWRSQTAARRIAYGLPSHVAPGATLPEVPRLVEVLTLPARWLARAWAAHHDVVVLDPAGVEAADAVLQRLVAEDQPLAMASLHAPPAVLDGLELAGITERLPDGLIAIREQARIRIPGLRRGGTTAVRRHAPL